MDTIWRTFVKFIANKIVSYIKCMDNKMVLKKTAQLIFKHSSLIADAVDKDFLCTYWIQFELSFFVVIKCFFFFNLNKLSWVTINKIVSWTIQNEIKFVYAKYATKSSCIKGLKFQRADVEISFFEFKSQPNTKSHYSYICTHE